MKKEQEEIENFENKEVEQPNDKKRGIVRRIVSYVILIVCLIALAYSSYVLFNWLMTNKQSIDMKKEIDNSVKVDITTDNKIGASFGIDFDKLESINPDVVGWIYIKGTSIDYAILKAGDNDYYLRRAIDGNYSWFGWPFMDYRNTGTFTDRNTIIYGHNIKSGLMFADLQDIQSGKYGNNIDIYIFTKDKTRVYRVFSTYIINPEDYYITTYFANNEEFGKFLENIASRSSIDFNLPISANDRILTLSTCTSDSVNRIVVHAKLYIEEDKEQ